MVCQSVYAEAQKAAEVYKWLQSEKAGRDLGVAAVKQWSKSHWLRFYRWCFVQHLCGERPWQEFDQTTFGLLSNSVRAPRELLDEILDRVRLGAENLSLIVWAHECLLPMDHVIDILEALDINSRRLPPPVEED